MPCYEYVLVVVLGSMSTLYMSTTQHGLSALSVVQGMRCTVAKDKCYRCGECCKWIAIPLAQVTDLRWYVVHGGVQVGDYIFLPIKCMHQAPDGTCLIYDEHRPETCKNLSPCDWPVHPPGCKCIEEKP